MEKPKIKISVKFDEITSYVEDVVSNLVCFIGETLTFTLLILKNQCKNVVIGNSWSHQHLSSTSSSKKEFEDNDFGKTHTENRILSKTQKALTPRKQTQSKPLETIYFKQPKPR